MPTKLLYLDCPTGFSGDMLLAALCSCGVKEAKLQEGLSRLPLPGWCIESRTVHKQGLAAHKIDFICAEEHSHRHLADILAMIDQAQLPTRAAALACRAFTLLAEAEANAHGCSVEEVHFHEVGAADAILDICGVALALHILDVEQVFCASLPLSGGFVECEHGRIPVPAPATLNLLAGYSFHDSGLTGELITPTGAALLRAMRAVQQKPSFTLETIGLGAGNRELPVANVLRVFLGEALPTAVGRDAHCATLPEQSPTTVGRDAHIAPLPVLPAELQELERDEVDVLTCNLDDSTGEALGHLLQLLMAAGALDASYLPLTMKKGRPAWQLQVLAPPCLTAALVALIFAESSGIGLRIRRESRLMLPRSSKTIDMPQGKISVKLAGNNIAPEYEDVAQAAAHTGASFKEVYRQAVCMAAQEKTED